MGISAMFSLAGNSIHNVHALANTVVKTCINRASAEQSTSPSPDTLLRCLKQIEEEPPVLMLIKLRYESS
ncbi:MAG: hypothetical protein QW179_04775 [Candidatus Hadarchaeales archaeon]